MTCAKEVDDHGDADGIAMVGDSVPLRSTSPKHLAIWRNLFRAPMQIARQDMMR